MEKILFKEESYKIIGACFEVYNEKGNGFLEAVYQECLRIEFINRKAHFIEKPKLELKYKGDVLEQTCEPDFLFYKEKILEIKAAKNLVEENRAQVFNYLKSTGKRLGLFVNFGPYPKLEYERIII